MIIVENIFLTFLSLFISKLNQSQNKATLIWSDKKIIQDFLH